MIIGREVWGCAPVTGTSHTHTHPRIEMHRMVPVVSLKMDLCPATGFHAAAHQAILTAPSKPVWA